MKISRLNFAKRIERLVSFPGIDENTLTIKKNVMTGITGSLTALSFMTMLGWIFDLPLIVTYGIILLSLTVMALFIIPHLRRHIDWFFFSIQFVIIWVTFYFMLRLGGLLNSAGLLFTGISVMFMSINLQNTKLTTLLFVSYLVSLISTALLQPFLIPAPEMTPGKNLLFFAVNFSWQAGFTLMLILNNIRQKKELAETRLVETIRLKELDEVKTRLFTNITHEFRTPLTLILGMANLVKEKPDEWLETGTEKIVNNGQNLLLLVNQMLDLSKLDSGSMPVHVYQQDIILQLRYLVESMSSLAFQRNISLKFKPGTDHLLMDYDADKFIHIATNLLSNALKYTQSGGSVMVTAGASGQENKTFTLQVHDNGPGIQPDQLPFIFDRFYTIGSNNGNAENGTGLGLALTKELVNLLNGTIGVESEPLKGTTFTVKLPVTNNAPVKEMSGFSDIKEKITLEKAAGIKSKPHSDKITEEKPEQPVLLIVEDSPDLVEYLSAILKNEYHLETAQNGKEGLQKAFEYIPDIILSDVMMPEMDGIAMLGILKTDQRTSHIPVVMLTAKADIASKLEGLERGADEYLAKPFNEEELLVRLKNLIDLRKTLRQRYSSMESLPETEDKSLIIEDAFILKVRGIMEAHLDNDQFGIRELCLEIGMSRAQLYRKFKSLTDTTVNDYLQNFRLFRAKEMLLHSGLNVSEVAYETGFKNLSHFSRSFKEAFGVTPGSIKK